MISVEHILLNYQEHPAGLTELPQISWSLTADQRDTQQTAYRIQLAQSEAFDNNLYDSSWVETDSSAQILLHEGALKIESGRRYYLRVKVQSNHQEESAWSTPVSFVTGVTAVEEWTAEFISGESVADKDESKGTLLRGNFSIDKTVSEAYAFLTAQGLYKAYLNGKKIGEDEMTPGWTSYNKRLLYQTYDITNLLCQGENVLGAMVGAGWYKGKMGFLEQRNNYGTQTAFMGQILIRFTDGSSMVWGTSEDFIACDAPILFSEIYDGEVYDARLERQEWLTPGSPDSYQTWRKVEKLAVDKSILASQPANRPCINERLAVQQILTTPEGDTVLDFGQNLTGWVEFNITASRGSKVVLECFEALDTDGNVYQANLRTAKEKIVYYTKGEGGETYHPSFTFQGFRYVKVTEYPVEILPENFTALVVHSKLDFTGTFECSNPLLNQLQHNIQWSLKGNFLDIPTDCPQRNERVGWTGDAQIFCRTANYITNAHGFFAKWLQDVAADQRPEGGVPHIVPDIVTDNPKVGDDWLLSQGTHSAAAWADVAVIAPWTLYLTYGDKQILAQQFQSMQRWIDFMEEHALDYIWNYKLQFGDWVALDAEEGSYFGATPNDLTCTAYFAYSTRLFAKICRILKKDDLAARYEDLYQKIVATYQRHFFTTDGSLTVKTQTAHIISLYFDLIPDAWKPGVASGLIDLLKEHDGHLVTGFVGTPYFCHALSDSGYVDEAYDLLLKEDFPSWLYQVKMGATTIWEHWDGIKPDGSMWSPDMNSFNHYAYGAIGEWLYRKVLGIEIDENEPGYQHILLKPLVNHHLDYAKGSYKSIHGNINVAWQYLDEKTVQLHCAIPANTSATVTLEGCRELLEDDGIQFTGNQGKIGSGAYTFTYKTA